MNDLLNLSVGPIDLSIVATYLLAALILGIRAGRKTKTMRDYAVASQTYDTPVIVCTLLATMVGANVTIGTIEKIHTIGIIWLVYNVVDALKMLMVSEWIAPRMQPFLNMISNGDVMDSLYGRYGKLIAGISTVAMSIGGLAVQATALGYVFQYYLNLSPVLGGAVGWGILLIYSVRGGMRSVTVTDVLQFIVLMVGLPFLCLFALRAVGGPLELYIKLPERHCTLFPEGQGLNSYWTLWILAVIPMLNPAIFQRLLMLKDTNRIRDAFRADVLLEVPLQCTIGLIGLAAVVLYPHIETKFIVPTMIQDLLPIGMKGLVIAGILAVIMSSADSILHVASLGLVRDILGALRPKKLKDATELRLSRISTLVIGLVAFLISINCHDIKALHFASLHAWSPIVLVPLIAGIFGLRTKPITFLLSAIAGFQTALVWKLGIQPLTGIDSLLPAIAANAVTFFTVHCASHPGTLRRWALSLWDRIRWRPGYYPRGYYPTPLKERIELFIRGINNFCKDKTDAQGIPYALFGLFVGAAYLGPYLMWSGSELNDSTVFMALRFTACVLCVLLTLQSSWPKALKGYIHIYWYFTLWFCLPTVSTYMLFAGNGGLFWWINLALSFLALLAVLDYVSFIFLSSFGVAAAMGLAKAFCIHFNPTLNPESTYLVGYFYFFASFGALLFIRSKEYIERRRQHNLKALSASVADKIKDAIGDVRGDYQTMKGLIADLYAGKQTFGGAMQTLEALKDRFAEIHYGAHRTLKMVNDNVKAEANIDDPLLWPNISLRPHLLKDIINKTIQDYALEPKELAYVRFVMPYNAHIREDEGLLSAVLGNLIQNALTSIKLSKKKGASVSIILKQCAWNPRLIIRDNGTGIDAKLLPNIFHQYNAETHTNAAPGLAFCKKAMTKMLGTIDIFSVFGEYTEVVLTFKGIRPYESLAWKTPETALGYEQLKVDSNGKVYWAKPIFEELEDNADIEETQEAAV